MISDSRTTKPSFPFAIANLDQSRQVHYLFPVGERMYETALKLTQITKSVDIQSLLISSCRQP